MIKGKSYRLNDVLWWTKPEVVLKEIANLMGLEYADTQTLGWFNYRTAASKNILRCMTHVEKEKLRKDAEDMAENGLPVDLQRK